MSKYDLVSIVRPTAEDSVVEELHKTITDLITTNGGNVSDQGVWQKRKLAYQIDTFNEGIYTITSFEGPGNMGHDFVSILKLHHF